MEVIESEFSHELSQNEARVLHSLVRWPDLTDQAIHSHISMKKSTFSSIKTRLRDQDYYQYYYIPNFPKIGFELCMLMFGELNRFTTMEERARIGEPIQKGFVEDFYVVTESDQMFSISIAENYTEFSKNVEQFFKLYTENNFFSKEGMNIIAYPFRISTILSFLDYESLLGNVFGFVTEPYGFRPSFSKGTEKKFKLTRAERKVLVGLIKYPDETDTLIAEEVGVSRNTVANAKRKFLKKQVCFPRVVPNLTKLGLNVISFNFYKYNAKVRPREQQKVIDLIRKTIAPYFFITKSLDGFFVAAHPTITHFRETTNHLRNYCDDKDFVTQEPVSYPLVIKDMREIKKISMLPMILKILKFDPKIPITEQK